MWDLLLVVGLSVLGIAVFIRMAKVIYAIIFGTAKYLIDGEYKNETSQSKNGMKKEAGSLVGQILKHAFLFFK